MTTPGGTDTTRRAREVRALVRTHLPAFLRSVAMAHDSGFVDWVAEQQEKITALVGTERDARLGTVIAALTVPIPDPHGVLEQVHDALLAAARWRGYSVVPDDTMPPTQLSALQGDERRLLVQAHAPLHALVETMTVALCRDTIMRGLLQAVPGDADHAALLPRADMLSHEPACAAAHVVLAACGLVSLNTPNLVATQGGTGAIISISEGSIGGAVDVLMSEIADATQGALGQVPAMSGGEEETPQMLPTTLTALASFFSAVGLVGNALELELARTADTDDARGEREHGAHMVRVGDMVVTLRGVMLLMHASVKDALGPDALEEVLRGEH